MGINVPEQVAYWRKGSEEDFAAAESLLQNGHVRHALFFAHLSLEKMLKALVCCMTNEMPSRTHNLIILMERAALNMTQETMEFLASMDQFNLAGRYPDARTPALSQGDAKSVLLQVSEVLACLKPRLSP
jgi:HEPN domain-containing protein